MTVIILWSREKEKPSLPESRGTRITVPQQVAHIVALPRNTFPIGSTKSEPKAISGSHAKRCMPTGFRNPFWCRLGELACDRGALSTRLHISHVTQI
jgi:hypothetical protein